MIRSLRYLLVFAIAGSLAACADGTSPEATPGTVSVRAYVDVDGSGTFTPGDTPLNGATVTLTPTDGGATQQASTDATGTASFSNVAPGAYVASLSASAPAGAVLAGATTPIIVVPFQGGVLSTEFRFANNPGDIAGVLYRDDDASGTFDPTVDTPAPGVEVALYAGSTATGDPIRTTSTDAGGAFSFSTLRPGEYTLVFTPFPTIELVGGNTVNVTVGAADDAAVSLQFTGNLSIPIAQARAAAEAGETGVVAVRGVVTFQPSFSDEIFIQDESGGIQVFAGGPPPRPDARDDFDLVPGDTVIIVGSTQMRFGEPQITNVTNIILQGRGAAPSPAPASAAAINLGQPLHALVIVEGATVLSVDEISFGNQLVTLSAADGTEFGVYVDSRIGVDAEDWSVGGLVDVTGVVNYDNRYSPFHYRVMPRSPADIQAGEAPMTIAAARAAEAGSTVTVAGVVTFQPSFSDELFIQDATGGIQVFSSGSNESVNINTLGLVPGDIVRLTGVTGIRFGELQISPVTSLAKIGSSVPPTPIAADADRIDAAADQHELAKVSGATVVSVQVLSFDNQFVTLTDADGGTVGVYVDSRTGVPSSTWTVGSVYDVTGVLNYDNRYTPNNNILVRSASDVVQVN